MQIVGGAYSCWMNGRINYANSGWSLQLLDE